MHLSYSKCSLWAACGRQLARLSAYPFLLAVFLVVAGISAHAQTATAPPADNANTLSEIIVTGSLLHRADQETESPVIVFTAEAIQQSGFTTVADVVRTISADNSGTIPTAFGSGFAAGASGVALRGLTVNSTLVLIDGRRAAPYALADDGQRSFVDLNTIPLDAVDRVEVLKDGASSIYGADAIAGVVNVILKKQYIGSEISAEVGAGQHAGGSTRRLTASVGAGDLVTDRFNVYFNLEFQGDDRILAGDRPFPFNTTNLSSIGGLDARSGTPGAGSGASTPIVAPAALAPGAASPGILNSTQTGAFRPLTPCAGPGVTAATAPSAIAGETDSYCLQNRQGYADDQPAQQRIGVSTRFTVKISDTMKAYTNVSYNQNNVYIDAAPSSIQNAVPVNTNNIALPPTLPNGTLNPNDPFAASGQYALIQYAFGDIPVLTNLKNHNARWVTGLQGQFLGWDYDSALVINHTWLDVDLQGLLNGAALSAAVQNGTYNFLNPSANSPALRAAISPALIKTSTTDLDSFDIKVTRDLVELPSGPLGIALGGEARYEAVADPALNPDNSVEGLGIAKTGGSRKVGGAYFEFGIPVVKPLNIDVSGRYDHYSDFGSSFTPKVGFKFEPIKQVALRGTYSKGFRAPSFAENGSSSAEGFSTIVPTAGNPFPAGYCAPTYHSAGYCQPYSIAQLSSANPNIKPEKSDSYTLGLIVEPVKYFSASVDAYAIKKKDVIEPPSLSPVLNAYLNGQPLPAGGSIVADLPDPAFPNSLPRPILEAGMYANENSLRTDGVDIDLQGRIDFDQYGKFTSDLSMTKIFSFKLVFADGSSNQYVGTQAPYILSSGAGTPRYRASWTNSWKNGPASLTLSTYYVSGFHETGVDQTGSPNTCLYTSNYCHVASFIDMDLTGIYRINDHLTTSFTIQNLMDRLPPIDPADYAATNYNPTYHQAGIIGRFFKVGVGYKF
jgi:iron complex outermembrane recepter protein